MNLEAGQQPHVVKTRHSNLLGLTFSLQSFHVALIESLEGTSETLELTGILF